MTVAIASNRFWDDVGRHHKAAGTTLTDLERLINRLGGNTLLSSLTSATVAKLIAKRRGDGVANATVNRGTTKLLRHIMNLAAGKWNEPDIQAIEWKRHLLPEVQERVRELTSDEQERLFAAIRPDYAALQLFRILSGVRLQEALDLRWSDIDWHARLLIVTGKGDKSRPIPITADIEDLLRAQPVAALTVFTYEAQRGRNKGQRYPMTQSGVKSYERRLWRDAGIENFRGHDLRHTAATRLLRATGNLRLCQQLLGHESVTTTTKYAHTTVDDLRAGMEAQSTAQTYRSIRKTG